MKVEEIKKTTYICGQCGYTSEKLDEFIELSPSIRKPEKRCPNCKSKVIYKKRYAEKKVETTETGYWSVSTQIKEEIRPIES